MRWVKAANERMRARGITKRLIAERHNLSEFIIGRALHLDVKMNRPNIEAIEAISRELEMPSPVAISDSAGGATAAPAEEGDPQVKKIRRNIQLLRQRAGFDVEGAADAAVVMAETWLRWERGELKPTLTDLELIAATLGHEPGHFWLDNPPPTRLGPHEMPWFRRRLQLDLPPDVRERLRKAEEDARKIILSEVTPGFVAAKKAQQEQMKKAKAANKPKGKGKT